MSKELVVSSTRHETRVAMIEDDQVTEIYYQREKEYSLAGSVHKGRVTRVLPGMQSAFVDIGLERDAFLYVSDFFEDNDEYDKVVTSVEEKVLRLEKGSGAAAGTTTPVSASSVTESPGAEAVVSVVAAPPPGNGQPGASATPAETRPEERDNRDRRGGHRSRRRRSKGRGLPESKYFSPRARTEPRQEMVAAAPVETAATGSAESDDDLSVLPGESLAKYGNAERGGGATEPPPIRSYEDRSGQEAETEKPGARADAGIDIAVIDEPPIRHDASEFLASGTSAEIEAQQQDEPIAEPPLAEIELDLDDSAEPEGELAKDLRSAGASEEIGTGGNHLENPAENATSEQQETAAAQEGDAEPARIATSLTATLREQNPRYLHRMSRRMRRKMRGGGAPAQDPPPQAGAEAVREVQAPEPRVEIRPETSRPPLRQEKSGQPSIADLLREGQEIIVQIAKEPLGQKGARITSHIALPGRFLVYMPTVDHIGVSRKIPSEEERTRLKRVLQANRTGIPGGYIVRTAGDGRTEEELRADMLFLYNMWLDIRQKAEKKSAPLLIHHDLDVVQRILRDQLTSAFKTIWVDNEEVYESVLRFVQRFQPLLVSRVKLYTRSAPIFDEFGVTSELEKALRPKVWLKSGGYIVINQTEALVAIDINTGKYVGKSNRLEDTIVKTNTDAVKEIVRQIRLRDLGGIIVVDFIDMDERKNRQKVMQVLEEAMRADRAPYKILQFNDFGLVAITRKRVKQSLERTLCSSCPYCEGAGYVKSVQTVIGEILQEAQKLAGAIEHGDVTLRVHPEVAKLLKSNKNDYLQELEQILNRTLLVKSDPQMHQEKFDLA
jgi:Rne/Rng family ribonuclease